MIAPMDTAALDARWAKWKQDGRRAELVRKERLRNILAALCLGGALLMFLRF